MKVPGFNLIRNNLKYKLIMSIYLVVMPLMVGVMIYIYHMNSKETVDNLIGAYGNMTGTLDQNINFKQDGIEELLTHLMINDQVRYTLNAEEGSPRYKKSLVWSDNSAAKYVKDTYAIKDSIQSVTLLPENGLTAINVAKGYLVVNQDLEQVRETEIYQKAYEAKGETVWTYVDAGNNELFSNNKSDKIVASRIIFNYAKDRSLGFLVISVEAEDYLELCKGNLQSDNECIYILNRNMKELMHAGQRDDEMLAYFREQAPADEQGCLEYQGNYLFYSGQQEGGNTVLHCVPAANWSPQLTSTVMTLIITALLLLAAVFPVSLLVAHSISKPLHKLKESMNKFKSGDFEQQVEVASHDEIGEVTDNYNSMVKDIKELIDRNYVMVLRERQSELDTLQAQINPHFLYNTLDSLYWQALNAGTEELAEDIMSLSELFRLVLNSGEGIITVEKEAALIERYLRLQKMRFKKKMDYKIDIDPLLMGYKMPKLLLQPFVENSVVHGLENRSEQGFVSVRGVVEGDYMLFEICDNGIGMTEEQITNLFQEERKSVSGNRVGRYAIKNVRERLILGYEDNFDLIIESEPGAGTRIIMKIPAAL